MTGALNDLRFAVRLSRQSPLATLSATVTLAVGLAANPHDLQLVPRAGVPPPLGGSGPVTDHGRGRGDPRR
jgi:hypothetical protein